MGMTFHGGLSDCVQPQRVNPWTRRAFFRLAAAGVLLPFPNRTVWAQSYPTRPVRIIVGFAAGSASDIVARLIGQKLSDRLGKPFIVENRGGAGGSLGAEVVARAIPDGYTLLLCASPDSVTINATLLGKSNFNAMHDIAPIASLARGPFVLVVHPSFPAKTIPEFIAYAKANPERVTFGSAGVGSVAHMAGELFMAMAGVRLVHVPYRGLGPAMTDLLGGQVQAIFSTMPPSVAHIRAGELRALAVTSAARAKALPDLPTIGDFLPGYEVSLVLGLGAPKSIPAEVVDRLNRETNAALADPDMKARLADLGNEPLPMTPADFGNLLAEDTEKWTKLIRSANIKSE